MSLYSIAAYGNMIADRPRFEAYRDALQQSVRPTTTVLDIGTGTGIHALIAAQLGARHVYAIETDDVIQVAREISRDNGLEDRITFIQETSNSSSLPERVDVIVSDMRGNLPLFSCHIPSIIDARERFLVDGGALIPQRDELFVAPVDAPEIYDGIAGPWSDNDTGLDMSAALRLATQVVRRKLVGEEQLLAPARAWTALDYATVQDANAEGEAGWPVERSATLHGFSVWFDTLLTDGVGFSNAPSAEPLIYGMNFFPLPHAVPVLPGDTIHLTLDARLLGDDYVWRWRTVLARGRSQSRGNAKAEDLSFDQSTFQGTPITPRSLRLADLDRSPTLSQDGRIDREALQMIDGSTPLREIAQRLEERYPEAFPKLASALDRVAALSRQYAE